MRSLQGKSDESSKGLLPEEVAEDQAKLSEKEEAKKEVKKELPKTTKDKEAIAKKKAEYAAKKKAQPQYEIYMKQTQTVTIEIPDGRTYSNNCTNNQCEVIIY